MTNTITRACAIEQCGREVGRHGARGWCPKHYRRWQSTGDPQGHKFVRRGASDDERLRFYLDTTDPSSCWEWQGFRDKDGYGRVSGNRASIRVASRIAYETWIGPIARGHVICHRCDNPPCCNPAHLFVGTSRDNTHDMLAKQRGNHGERHQWQRITDEQVHLIRYLSDQGMHQRPIAKYVGCSQSQVSNIVRHAQRKHDTNWQAKPEVVAWVAKNARKHKVA